ncbi:MAG TPA: PaaI family thioesterase [Vicinamibacterales bacterium]|nr:PaaI family thioesterase [Vicinamibacterales bacterium]
MTEVADVAGGVRSRLHPHCIVCGADNPRGLGLVFTPCADRGGVEARFDCAESVEGYVGLVHGGVVSMLMDAAMAQCLFHLGCVAHTGELHIRFRHPVVVGHEARVRAWQERSRGRLHVLGADLRQDGCVKAVATAKFLEPAATGEAARTMAG